MSRRLIDEHEKASTTICADFFIPAVDQAFRTDHKKKAANTYNRPMVASIAK